MFGVIEDLLVSYFGGNENTVSERITISNFELLSKCERSDPASLPQIYPSTAIRP